MQFKLNTALSNISFSARQIYNKVYILVIIDVE